MTDALWKKNWDILFFAGHSSSDQGKGQFIIAQEQWMAPSDMKFSIQRAAKNGLKLAIFNSCDGLAIAIDLVQNDVPFIITMREPVPDDVAQVFLSYFLSAYAADQSLFQAFQQAQKRLESLEDFCPCATWLPVLICNPLVAPPDWPNDMGSSIDVLEKSPKRRLASHHVDSLMFFAVILLVLVGRSLGFIQSVELWAFDQLMQHRPYETQDSRLLIVEIDEAAIQNQERQSGAISDLTLNQALRVLSRHQPRVIGLDIYRDNPSLDPALQDAFQNLEQVIGICKSPDLDFDKTGVSAPLGLPKEQLGFSDVLEDPDGVVRRQILFMNSSPTKACAARWSLSSVLAKRYLVQDGISYRFSQESKVSDRRLILGEQKFPSIRQHWGGYQRIDAGGGQILLNYRANPTLDKIAEVVKIEDVLENDVPDESIRDRVVMIGVTANTSTDFWETPYGSAGREKLSGVFLQAHMVSQMISAVKDLRPLIYVWPHWLETIWIAMWGFLGLGLPLRPVWLRWGLLILSGLSLIFLSYLGLLGGLWMPLVPSLMALLVMGSYQNKGLIFKLSKLNRSL